MSSIATPASLYQNPMSSPLFFKHQDTIINTPRPVEQAKLSMLMPDYISAFTAAAQEYLEKSRDPETEQLCSKHRYFVNLLFPHRAIAAKLINKQAELYQESAENVFIFMCISYRALMLNPNDKLLAMINRRLGTLPGFSLFAQSVNEPLADYLATVFPAMNNEAINRQINQQTNRLKMWQRSKKNCYEATAPNEEAAVQPVIEATTPKAAYVPAKESPVSPKEIAECYAKILTKAAAAYLAYTPNLLRRFFFATALTPLSKHYLDSLAHYTQQKAQRLLKSQQQSSGKNDTRCEIILYSYCLFLHLTTQDEKIFSNYLRQHLHLPINTRLETPNQLARHLVDVFGKNHIPVPGDLKDRINSTLQEIRRLNPAERSASVAGNNPYRLGMAK